MITRQVLYIKHCGYAFRINFFLFLKSAERGKKTVTHFSLEFKSKSSHIHCLLGTLPVKECIPYGYSTIFLDGLKISYIHINVHTASYCEWIMCPLSELCQEDLRPHICRRQHPVALFCGWPMKPLHLRSSSHTWNSSLPLSCHGTCIITSPIRFLDIFH